MANEPYNINIETKAQLEEIQKLLEELRAISAEISKINGQTFSAVSSSAAELSKTSKDLAEALTANKKAFEELPKATDKAAEGAKKFGEESKRSEQVIQGFFLELGAVGARLATQLPSAISSAIKAFGEEEVALAKLSAAIRSNGGNVAEVLPVMQQFASDMQRITGYADDQILSMQGVATSMGVSSEQMETVMQSAIGLSSALGMDVATATKAASAAIQGKTELLTRYIPTLSMCKTEEEKLAKVQELSRNGFAQAQDAAGTLMGRLNAASKAWGDLQEVVGEAFAPAVKSVAGLLQGVCEILTEFPAVTKTLTVSLTSLAVGFAFTKVGGLANVARMLIGVSSATNGATVAMHGFNLAIKANPIGLIASLATAAVLGLAQLAEYLSSVESEEEKEAQAQEAARIARQKAKEETMAASAVLKEYSDSLDRENESLPETAERIRKLGDEIESLSDRSKWKDGEQVQMAQKLVDKKKELVQVQQLYLDRIIASGQAEYEFASSRETERKYRVEMELNEARKAGIAHIVAFKENELKHIEALEKSAEIQKQYYEDHKYLIESEADRARIMADAKDYADMRLEQMRQESAAASDKAATETWLNAELEKGKDAQRGLEWDILKARSQGNEADAVSLEGKLRIAQLSAEIFENTRKEGMTRAELETLTASATRQAQERYDMEKSVTDEVQRQNLAKNAQAKIEDILITNKIEQLKAEGKLSEARELEREREIKRTLAGLEGVSDKDRESLAATLRQTNDYKDMQEAQRSSGGGASSGRAQAYGGSSLGGARARSPRPASVSAKNAGLYDEWKNAGGNRSGESWTDFRKRRQAENSAAQKSQSRYNQTRETDAKTDRQTLRTRAAENLSGLADKSKEMASRVKVGGNVDEAAGSQPNADARRKPTPDAESPSSPDTQKKSGMAAKLQNRGVSPAPTNAAAGSADNALAILKRIELQVSNLAANSYAR